MNAHRLTFLLGCLCVVLVGCQTGSTSLREGGPPKLGLQAYTFRAFTFEETLDKAKAAGIGYLQIYAGQKLGGGMEGTVGHTMDEPTRARVLQMARDRGVRLVSYGVITGQDEADWRQIFAFAKSMGLEQIASEPTPEDLPLVDRLSRESGVGVALHNHPVPSTYAHPETALAAVQPYGRHLGLCADTGHWVRSGHDPVATLRQAEDRILELHFKDLNQRNVRTAHDVPWGLGASEAAGQILELRRQKFGGYVFIEYEHDTPALEQEVARSAEFFRRALAAPEESLRRGLVVPATYTQAVQDTWSGGKGRNSQRWQQPQPLFAPDLSNAEFQPGSWVWENGILLPRGGGDLWTKESYGDFAVSLEFRCAPDSNSGVFLRCGDLADWLNTAIEIQIRQGDEPDPKHLVGAIFDCLAPKRQVEIEPGVWYQYVITARGNLITVTLNGESLIKADLAQWTEPHKNPDGSPNKFARAYSDMPRAGRIGLQYHGTPIEFRNLMVEHLSPPPPSNASQK